MGLFFGFFFGVMTLAGSALLLFAEASIDTRGDQKPVLTIAYFLGGAAVTTLCIVTHYHPIGW